MLKKDKEPVVDSSTNVGSSGNNYANKEKDSTEKQYSVEHFDPEARLRELAGLAYFQNRLKRHEDAPERFLKRRMMQGIAVGSVTGAVAAAVFIGIVKSSGISFKNADERTEIITAMPVVYGGADITYDEDDTYSVTAVAQNAMPFMVSIINLYSSGSAKEQIMGASSESSGSGIIIGNDSEELLIATNYHVVVNAQKIEVTFIDGKKANAKRKGIDPEMDLAVISIPLNQISNSTLEQIAVATLGNSDNLVIGERVIAIGNALGYGQSVTTGIISALNRQVVLSDDHTEKKQAGNFIQTDAAINPGNSGGALLNEKGEVIGINTSKIQGGMIEGMGYAIPISAAEPIIETLMTKESKDWSENSNRGVLGIAGKDVTEEAHQDFGMPRGIYISNVMLNSAAADAGLKNGDIISAIEGTKVTSMDSLKSVIACYAAGDTIELEIERITSNGYEKETIELTLKTIK